MKITGALDVAFLDQPASLSAPMTGVLGRTSMGIWQMSNCRSAIVGALACRVCMITSELTQAIAEF